MLTDEATARRLIESAPAEARASAMQQVDAAWGQAFDALAGGEP